MQPVFHALPADLVAQYRTGGPDAHGQSPERRVSAPGDEIPCRASLTRLAPGSAYLVLAHRPFTTLQPYAETGPIFLAAEGPVAAPSPALPPFLTSPAYILRGYGADERIVYGSGAVVPTHAIIARARTLLERPEIAFLHIRSATNNCFHCRVERGES